MSANSTMTNTSASHNTHRSGVDRKAEAKKLLGLAYHRTRDAATNWKSRWERKRRQQQLEAGTLGTKRRNEEDGTESSTEWDDHHLDGLTNDRQPLIAQNDFDDEEHEPLVG